LDEFDIAVVGLGALGSAAAYQLARRGAKVIAFEQFELGHVRGASHDTSRIVRHSYESEEYVRLAVSAYRDWADFEEVAGETFVTETGGLVFCAPDTAVPSSEYAEALSAVGIPFEILQADQVNSRWPQFSIPAGVTTVYTPTSGIAHAARSVAALQMQARAHGAVIRDRCRVDALEPTDDGGAIVTTEAGQVKVAKVVLCTDAWINKLLEPLGLSIPLVTMQEQVTYFKPAAPADFEIGKFPVWIWEGKVSYYGFPQFGEPTIKAARDVSEIFMNPDERTFVPSEERRAELRSFLGAVIPASGPDLRTVTCQYALTPDREFVLGPLADYPQILVGLGAGHAFKFTPTIGRVLAELALTGETSDDISRFSPNGPVRSTSFATARI
jgi:sarcosine oxidase